MVEVKSIWLCMSYGTVYYLSCSAFYYSIGNRDRCRSQYVDSNDCSGYRFCCQYCIRYNIDFWNRAYSRVWYQGSGYCYSDRTMGGNGDWKIRVSCNFYQFCFCGAYNCYNFLLKFMRGTFTENRIVIIILTEKNGWRYNKVSHRGLKI